jgi:single-stranded-DNA-specific exonuclease
VLAVRGFTDAARAKSFLRPLLDELHDPTDLPDAGRAAQRILEAIRAGEHILVHGDYDVDGVSGVTLLTRWIRRLGGRVTPFVPHRLRDGYDFGPAGLAAARGAGASLVVTVDCGIMALDSVARARAEGIDVIVTDHHTPGPALPDALAVVNPNRPESTYPNPGLCGTGVAFKLCQLLAGAHGVDDEELYASLDLVALATVADLVPLQGENRTLVRYGLRALGRTTSVGLQALLERAGVRERDLDAGKIGFILAPRINAVGRMGAASTALSLLLTGDPDEARRLAGELEEQNRVRQETDRRTLRQALEMLSAGYDPARDFGVVLASDEWHPGVIGIVASRVVERIHRPTVLVALEGERGRGSARSIPGFHLYDAIDSVSEHLTRFGGHKHAAGMDLQRSSLDDFRAAFNREAARRLDGVEPRPTVRGDLEVRLDEVTMDLAHFGRYLGPFGISNPRPVFVARDVELTAPPRVVKDEHLKLHLSQGGTRLEAIGFRLLGRISPEDLGLGPVDLAFHVDVREFRGRRSVQARILDVRRSGPAA